MYLAAWKLKFENELAFKSFSKEKVTYIYRINSVFFDWISQESIFN